MMYRQRVSLSGLHVIAHDVGESRRCPLHVFVTAGEGHFEHMQ